MKAKVKETGEIIDVKCLYSVTYSRLDCNGKIIEEYDEDELEFEPRSKMVSLEKAVKWLESVNLDYYQIREGVFSTELVEDFRKAMEA
jgi:hypothetical protein